MALTPDQIQSMRVQYGLAKAPAAAPAVPAAAPTGTPAGLPVAQPAPAPAKVTLPPGFVGPPAPGEQQAPKPQIGTGISTNNMPPPQPPQKSGQDLLDIINNAKSGKPPISSTPANLPTPDNRPAIVKASDAINKPAYDMSSESRVLPTIGKTVANQAKSLGKLVVGAPAGIASTFAQLPGAITGYGQDHAAAVQSQLNVNTGVVKLNALINDLRSKDPNAKDPNALLTNGERLQQAETALKAAGGIVLPNSSFEDFAKEIPGAAVKSVDAPFIDKAIQTYKSATPEDLKANQFGHSGPLARLLEAVHTGVQSVAEDPQQITPYFLAGKEAIEKYAPGLDSTISGAAEPVISTASGALDAVKSIPGALKDKFSTPVENAIQDGIQKGIKPTVVGKQTLAKSAAFYDSATNVVKDIAQNRDKIQIVGKDGEMTNRPSTVAEFAQAIDQGKQNIYDRYNSLTKEATGQGVQIPTDTIVKQLENTAADSNTKLPPEVRAYAEKQIPAIQELHNATPDVIESRIQYYNQKLQNFYKNPTGAGQIEASVDASIATKLRAALDDKISQATDATNQGPGYQELKNTYGDYKALEKEVMHRATVVARAAPKPISSLTDIFTGGEILSGVLTGNPAAIAKGAFGKVLQLIYRNLNSPDANINRMFKTVYDKVPSNSATNMPAAPAKLPALPGQSQINDIKTGPPNKDEEQQ